MEAACLETTMHARSSSNNNPESALPGELSSSDDLLAPGPRVVSLSPHASDSKASAARGGGNPSKPSTSRSDEAISAMVSAGEALRVLIEQANAATLGLGQLLTQEQDCQDRSAKSSMHLQERLRLSARMLQAFQSQIGRVESAMAVLTSHDQRIKAADDQIEKKVAGLDAQMDSALARFEDRLKAAEKSALERFELQLAQRQEMLISIQARLEAFDPRIDSLGNTLEQVQASVTILDSTNMQSVEQARAAAAEMNQIAHRCEAVGRTLSTEVSGANEEMNRAVTRREEIRRSVQESLYLSAAAEQSLREQLKELQEASANARVAIHSADALREMLPRLKPWEALLLGPDANSRTLPEPLARIADDVQRRINQEMGWLSTTMREVAQRIEQFGAINSTLAVGVPAKEANEPGSTAHPQINPPAGDNPPGAPLRFHTWAGRA